MGETKARGSSSGVKLLGWKIALTVMMLLFQVARVTLSFTSAMPAGTAGLPVSAELLTGGYQSRGFHPSLEEQATGELVASLAPGAAILGEPGLANTLGIASPSC